MADKASDSLPYGHFGGGSYSLDSNDWYFGRSTTFRPYLRHIGTLEVIAKGAAKIRKAHARSGGGGEIPSRRREKQSKTLSKSYPELQPALPSLLEFVDVSEAIEDAASKHGLVNGRLIATGKIYDESRRDYIPALVFPCGPTGSDLRLVEGLRQRQGWDEDRTAWIESFSYTGRSGIWKGPGVPILSISFAHPLERGEHYLAVRLQCETLIFRPVLSKGTPTLKPNLVFTISIDETGGSMHADVTFNPWFTGQLAIIDEAGRWSIWESGRRSNAIKNIKEGSLGDEMRRKQASPVNDGWGSASWVESAFTICIATRWKLVLLDLEATAENATMAIDMDLKGGLGWILHVASAPTLNGNLVVVTSSHIVVLLIERSSKGELSSRTIWQARHHRNPEDVSMRTDVCVSGDDTVLILSSAADPEVHQYLLRLSGSDMVMMQLPNAFDLPRPAAVGRLDFDVDLTPLNWNDDALSSIDTPSLYHVHVLGRDLSVFRSLCKFGSGQEQSSLHGSPKWTINASKTAKQSKKISTDVYGTVHDELTAVCKAPEARYVQRRRIGVSQRAGYHWTVSYVRLLHRLSETQAYESTDIEEIIEEATSYLQGSHTAAAKPMSTLLDLANGSVESNDVSGASARLERLSLLHAEQQKIRNEDEYPQEDSQAAQLEIRLLEYPAAQSARGTDGLGTLLDGLEMIRKHFLAPAADALRSVTARREALARQAAAEVTLAGRVLQHDDTTQEQTQKAQNQSQVWDLPIRPPAIEEWSQDTKLSGHDEFSRATTPALPTPSASASSITGSSRPADFAAPEAGRLSRYITFTKSAPSTLPRALNKVLGHWTVGSNPSEYDWQTTARKVSRRDEEADQDEMTEKERRQMQRRAERYMRRQRREAEESQRQQMLSSQAPEIVSASQPAQRPGPRRMESPASAGMAVGSSQKHGASQLAASQVVPGRHGGRPPAKKKRKSGF